MGIWKIWALIRHLREKKEWKTSSHNPFSKHPKLASLHSRNTSLWASKGKKPPHIKSQRRNNSTKCLDKALILMRQCWGEYLFSSLRQNLSLWHFTFLAKSLPDQRSQIAKVTVWVWNSIKMTKFLIPHMGDSKMQQPSWILFWGRSMCQWKNSRTYWHRAISAKMDINQYLSMLALSPNNHLTPKDEVDWFLVIDLYAVRNQICELQN